MKGFSRASGVRNVYMFLICGPGSNRSCGIKLGSAGIVFCLKLFAMHTPIRMHDFECSSISNVVGHPRALWQEGVMLKPARKSEF